MLDSSDRIFSPEECWADGVTDLGDEGIEFSSCDLIESREHRLRVLFHPDGELEIVVVHGAKCDEPGVPTEVLCLSNFQTNSLILNAISWARMQAATKKVKEMLRKRCTANEISCGVVAALTGSDYNSILKIFNEQSKNVRPS